MLYLYDVWVNWFDGEEAGYNVCPYYEWRKTDQIEIVEQIPVLYITESLYDYIENGLSELPAPLLSLIHNRAYLRNGHQRKLIDYASIITDGRGIIAFHTLGYKIPFRKSRLIPRQEQQVYELCKKLKRRHFSFLLSATAQKSNSLHMESHTVAGLTRRERQLKKCLMIALEQLKMTDNLKEIRYWLSEWENEKVDLSAYDMSIQQVWERIYEQVIDGWSERHERFGAQLVKGNPFLENYWEEERIEQKNKENQK